MTDYLDELDDEQRAAVLANPKPLKVLAGAGSGKTRVIISRIAFQIDTEVVAPGKIFASAFTKAAAEEMNERIVSLVDADDLQIGTFHSIMFRFMNEWATRSGTTRWGVLKPYEQKNLIVGLIDHPTRDFPDALDVDVDPLEVLSHIGRWKNNLIHHDDPEITETMDEAPVSTGIGAAARIYPMYESYKSKMNKIDFDDMLLMSFDLLSQNADALDYARNKWDAFFIDEAQDTNHAQWEIVRLLAPPASDPNLTIVGDTRQALYRFRGAIPELMDNFNTMYPTATTVDLVKNYRSTNQVINTANSLVSTFSMKDQVPVRGSGHETVVMPFIDERDQADEISNLLTELKETKGLKGGDVAILVRTNAQTLDIERALVMGRHPYWCRGGGFFSHREIADILAYIRLAVDPTDITPLYRIINKPTRYLGKAFVEAVERNLSRSGGNVINAIQITDSYGTRKLSKPQRFEVEKLVHFLRKLSKVDSSRAMVKEIVEGLGYLAWLRKNEGINDDVDDSRTENIEALKNACFEFSNPADLVAFADMTDKLQFESGDATEICTVHRAKGREWPVVIVSNFYEKSIPHVLSLREGGEADERRVAYVAFTRARDLLVVTYPLETSKYGAVAPSRYLADSMMPDIEVAIESLEWGETLADFMLA